MGPRWPVMLSSSPHEADGHWSLQLWTEAGGDMGDNTGIPWAGDRDQDTCRMIMIPTRITDPDGQRQQRKDLWRILRKREKVRLNIKGNL